MQYDEPRHKVWVLLYQTPNLLMKCTDKVLSETGLSLQQYITLMIMECIKAPTTISELARHLDRNANSVSMITDRMEKNGLVRRVRDLPDRRSLRLELTEKGREKLAEATKPGWELIERVTSSFTEEERSEFVHLMEKLRKEAFEELGKSVNDCEAEGYR